MIDTEQQTDNDIKDTIKGWMEKRVNEIHTAIPGKIIEYDPATNKAKVQPIRKFKMQDFRELEFPIIHDVPLHFPLSYGAKAGLTLPIKPDDLCLIIFQESQIDDFLSQSDNSMDLRKHSLNDAIAIPGVYPFVEAGEETHPDSVCLKMKDTEVWLNEEEIVAYIPETKFRMTKDEATLEVGGSKIWLNESEFAGNVGGTEFSFSGGDLVVNGISHCHHVHGGVERGGAKTNEPE